MLVRVYVCVRAPVCTTWRHREDGLTADFHIQNTLSKPFDNLRTHKNTATRTHTHTHIHTHTSTTTVTHCQYNG